MLSSVVDNDGTTIAMPTRLLADRAVRLILVSGAPRSGISLTASQLASLPDAQLIEGPNSLSERWLWSVITQQALSEELKQQWEAQILETHGRPYWQARLLIIPLPILSFDPSLLTAIIGSCLALQACLVVVERNMEDAICSAARFPFFNPQLPNPHDDSRAFIEAATDLYQKSKRNLRLRMTEGKRLGYGSQKIRFEHLIEDPRKCLQHLIGTLQLGEIRSSREQPQGISPSFCFRERPIDRFPLGRAKRTLTRVESLEIRFKDSCLGLQRFASSRKTGPAGKPSQQVIASVLNCIHTDPIILTGRGGSGTRLLAELALTLGIDLGKALNKSLDSIQWADLIYEMSLANLNNRHMPWRGTWATELKHRALCTAPKNQSQRTHWGFKLPEVMLIAHELMEAWPSCRVVHLVRHPVDVCLRRTHMTSRPNNPIGLAVLNAAYKKLEISHSPQVDPPHWRNAVSWWYQLSQIQHLKRVFPQRVTEIRYEDLCDQPQASADELAKALGVPTVTSSLRVNRDRRQAWTAEDSRSHDVWALCKGIAKSYGYSFEQR